jgi:tetratricopeptide (TPR) repeat protein
VTLYSRSRLYTFLSTIPFDVLVFCLYFHLGATYSLWPVLLSLLPTACVGYFVCRFSGRAVNRRLLRRATESCQRAFEEGNVSTCRREAAEIVAFFRRGAGQPAAAVASIAEAGFLGVEERYDDALAILEGIDAEGMDDTLKSYILNGQAWYKAQLGRSDEAVALARRALELAELSKSRIVASCRGTLGTALFAADRPNEALPLLLKAFEGHSGDPRLRAANAYYLGAVYTAINQIPQARSWYERATHEAPKTRYGAMAIAALRDLKDS